MTSPPSSVEVGRYLEQERRLRGVTLATIEKSSVEYGDRIPTSTVQAALVPDRRGRRPLTARRAAVIASAIGLSREKFRADLDLAEDDTWLDYFGPPEGTERSVLDERGQAALACALDELWARWCAESGFYPSIRPPGVYQWEYTAPGMGTYSVGPGKAYDIVLFGDGSMAHAHYQHAVDKDVAAVDDALAEMGANRQTVSTEQRHEAHRLAVRRGWMSWQAKYPRSHYATKAQEQQPAREAEST